MQKVLGTSISLILLAGCSGPQVVDSEDPGAVTITAVAETTPTALDGANGVAIWVNASDPERSLILGAAEDSGLEVYGLDGLLRQSLTDIAPSHVDVQDGFAWVDGPTPLVLASDGRLGAVIGYRIDGGGRLERLPGAPIAAGDEITGLCSYRSPRTGRVYALATTDLGVLHQWELYVGGGELSARLVRSVALGKGVEFCAVDDSESVVYYADERIGLMSLPAEAETEPARSIVDMAAPRGGIAEEIKGVAFARGPDGTGFLIAADVSAERFVVYGADGALSGRFRIGAAAAVDAVGEGEGAALALAALGERYPEGLLVVADPENEGAHGNYKLLGWRELRTTLGLAVPGTASAAESRPVITVQPAVETAPVASFGDAADDPAIWVHPRDPMKSLVIGTDKKLGLYVYDLEGRLLQTLADGRMNNVDLRDGFSYRGRAQALVAASNRTDKSIALYLLDPATRRLDRVGDPVPTGFKDPYGLCMYAAPDGGGHYVIVNNADDGLFRQWRIRAEGERIVAELAREFLVGTQSEGCVADDEARRLYVAEEDGGFWRYGADPGDGDERFEIDRIDGPTGLKGDIEGVAIWHGQAGRGYLVLSNQGADNYAVYRREGDNAYVGTFNIVADPALGIDGVSETDGLEVASAALGPRFPDGLLVVQDGRNLAPAERQNFKYVSWEDIAAALGLD